MAYATVAALNVYPVKSCRGIALERATVGLAGIEGDRRWMVVSEQGRFFTQRELPRLALVVPRFASGELILSAPGMSDIAVPMSSEGPRIEVKVWGDPCTAFDMGAALAQWFTQWLERPVRLVRFDPEGVRRSDPKWSDGVETRNEFSDGFPLLVISQASLSDLNGRLTTALPMNRFRPNVVLSGVEAYDEDRIRDLYADELRMRIVKPCDRCVITTTDQARGEVAGDEPLRTLKSYRFSKPLRGVLFGQNAVLVSGAGRELHVGQQLQIEWS